MLLHRVFCGALLFYLNALRATPATAANILAIHPFPGPSQYLLVQPYLKALAARGHNLTVISAFPQKENIANYHDLPVLEARKHYDESMTTVFESRSKWDLLNFLSEFCEIVVTAVLSNAEVQRQLFQVERSFDLIIVESYNLDALYGFAQHFNAPIIGISTFGTDVIIDDYMDNNSPWSYVPTFTTAFTDYRNFGQRLWNTVHNILEYYHIHFAHLPQQLAIYKQYFPNATKDLLEVRKSFSLMLINYHSSFGLARPYVPNIIEVGGWHISNNKFSTLTPEMTKFLDESTNGVIYFAMGTNIKSTHFSKATIDMFLHVFAKLPQRVMWKFEEPNLPGKPDNLFIAKWFPQIDILAHPNVKLFISHGGLISSIESIYHGKPIVGIPVFLDQFFNVQTGIQRGYAEALDINTLTEDNLYSTIQKVLNNSSYTMVAQQLSRRLRDQPQHPMDTAIYWTEYVLRHKGATHLRAAAQHLNFIQHYSLDTIGTLIVVLLLAMYVFVSVFLKLIVLLSRFKHAKSKTD